MSPVCSGTDADRKGSYQMEILAVENKSAIRLSA